jgi:hypothetical protein
LTASWKVECFSDRHLTHMEIMLADVHWCFLGYKLVQCMSIVCYSARHLWLKNPSRDILVTDLPIKIAIEFSKSFMLDQTPTTDFGLIFNRLYFVFSPHTKKSLKSYTYIY